MLVEVQEIIISGLILEIIYFVIVVVYIIKGDGVCSKFKIVIIIGVVLGWFIMMISIMVMNIVLFQWYLFKELFGELLGYWLQYCWVDEVWFNIIDFGKDDQYFIVIGLYKGIIYIFWFVVKNWVGLGEEFEKEIRIFEDLFSGFF